MIAKNGSLRMYSGSSFHSRHGPRGECRGPRYIHRQRRTGLSASLRAMSGVHLRLAHLALGGDSGLDPMVVNNLHMMHRNGTITGGLVGELVLLLQGVLGFSYSLHPVAHTTNLSAWDRVVEELYAGRADMMAGKLLRSLMRGRLLDFSCPFLTERSGAVIDQRYTHVLNRFRMTQPLESRAWYALLAVQTAAVLVLCLVTWCHLRMRGGSLDAEADPPPEAGASFWFLIVLGVFCQQGAVVRADGALSYRLAISAVYLLSFFIFACYSGTLLAQMAITRYEMPFATLNQALEQGWRVSNFTSSLGLRETVVQPLMGGRDLPQLPTSSDGPLQGRNLLLMTSATTDGLFRCLPGGSQEGQCPVCMHPGTTIRHDYSLVFRPHFPYLRLVNYVIPQLIDRGIMSRVLRRWQPRGISDILCPTNTVALEKTQFGVDNLKYVFLIVLAGTLSAIVVLFMERVASLLSMVYDRSHASLYNRLRPPLRA
ncbi:glutamate receptor 1-like [Pollicipes pollicipes]|uniref:glutamate receptor 1-like n=1 Tax=Pollicipes pollicipes TaxID=41117 RepID=UPI0018858C16|nr:glutamate receptor 1-like [Pollicipes pollicipes]